MEVSLLTISKDNSRIQVTLPKKYKKIVKQLGQNEKRSASNMAAKIIEQYLVDNGYIEKDDTSE